MNRVRLVETAAGGVHVVNVALAGSEYTLCGDAFDLSSDGEPGTEWRETKSRTVTCPKCAAVVRLCRGVRVSGGSPLP